MARKTKRLTFDVTVIVPEGADAETVASDLRKQRRFGRRKLSYVRKQEYNGYSNYATWSAHLWMTNDQETQQFWLAASLDALVAARDHENTKPDGDRKPIWTVHDARVFILADAMKEALDKQAERQLRSQSSMMADLLNSALQDVNYNELAEAFIDD